MNVLFLTIGRLESIDDNGIYPDLLRCFHKNGHDIYTVSPYEKRTGKRTDLKEFQGVHMLHVEIGNITKCSIIEKGFSTLRIETQFLSAIKKFFEGVRFDLVLYSTPPITFVNVIEYIKKRDNSKTYLLLKDIFPQNAVDLGIMRMTGIKGQVYKYFRNKEKRLYAVSDYIGCMSQANVNYILTNNSEVLPEKVEICPNCIEVQERTFSEEKRLELRRKYNIPQDAKVFVYGGNLGKPQGIPFIIECMKKVKDVKNVFFLIVGEGTEYVLLDEYAKRTRQENLRVMRRLPKDDYDIMISTCDVGLIFLDYRFTIPNFPSRMLSYMQAKLPVLACTDSNTDIGRVIAEGDFGWWCESNDVNMFYNAVIGIVAKEEIKEKGEKAFDYLKRMYDVNIAYNTIMRSR